MITELDKIKQELHQAQDLLKQEQGKRLAVERDSYEIKRNAKIAVEQADALKAETEASLVTASQQMQVGHAVSCGIWAFGQLGKAFMARKVAAARVIHRELQLCLLLQQFIDGLAKKDQLAIQAASDKAASVIETIKKDGEQARLSAAEASLGYGFKEFEKVFDKLVSDDNVIA